MSLSDIKASILKDCDVDHIDELKEAENLYKRERNAQSRFKYGYSLVKTKDASNLQTGVRICSDLSDGPDKDIAKEAPFFVALAYFKLDNFEEAQNWATKGLRLDPNNQQLKALQELANEKLGGGKAQPPLKRGRSLKDLKKIGGKSLNKFSDAVKGKKTTPTSTSTSPDSGKVKFTANAVVSPRAGATNTTKETPKEQSKEPPKRELPKEPPKRELPKDSPKEQSKEPPKRELPKDPPKANPPKPENDQAAKSVAELIKGGFNPLMGRPPPGYSGGDSGNSTGGVKNTYGGMGPVAVLPMTGAPLKKVNKPDVSEPPKENLTTDDESGITYSAAPRLQNAKRAGPPRGRKPPTKVGADSATKDSTPTKVTTDTTPSKTGADSVPPKSPRGKGKEISKEPVTLPKIPNKTQVSDKGSSKSPRQEAKNYVTSKENKFESKSQTEVKSDLDLKPKSEVKADLNLKAKPEVKSEVKADLDLKAKPEVKADLNLKVKPEVKADLDLKAKPEVKTDLNLKAKPEVKSDLEYKSKVDFKPKSEVKVEHETKLEVKSELKSEPKNDFKTKTGSKPKTPSESESESDLEPDFNINAKYKSESSSDDSEEIKYEPEKVSDEHKLEPSSEQESEDEPDPETEPEIETKLPEPTAEQPKEDAPSRSCTLCKKTFPESTMKLISQRPFCTPCATRVINAQKERLTKPENPNPAGRGVRPPRGRGGAARGSPARGQSPSSSAAPGRGASRGRVTGGNPAQGRGQVPGRQPASVQNPSPAQTSSVDSSTIDIEAEADNLMNQLLNL